MNPPFPFNQPIERYRLYHQMSVAAFVDFLEIPETLYLRMLAGDRDVPDASLRQVARRLQVPRWLINECAPTASAKESARLEVILKEGRTHGYYRIDSATGKAVGPVFLDETPVDHLPPPADHLQLAEALIRLNRIHMDGADPDYPALHTYISERIRATLRLESSELFDVEAWANLTIDASSRLEG